MPEPTEASIDRSRRWWLPVPARLIAAGVAVVALAAGCGDGRGDTSNSIDSLDQAELVVPADLPASLAEIDPTFDPTQVLTDEAQRDLAIRVGNQITKGKPAHVEQLAELRRQLDKAITNPRIKELADEYLDLRTRRAAVNCVPLFMTSPALLERAEECDHLSAAIRDPAQAHQADTDVDRAQLSWWASGMADASAKHREPTMGQNEATSAIVNLVTDPLLHDLAMKTANGDLNAARELEQRTDDAGKEASVAAGSVYQELYAGSGMQAAELAAKAENYRKGRDYANGTPTTG